jgi:hypothetical protein
MPGTVVQADAAATDRTVQHIDFKYGMWSSSFAAEPAAEPQ